VNALLVALLASALIMIQLAISGTRLVFSLPAYAVLAICALLVPFVRREGREPSKWCLAIVAVFFSYIIARGYTSPIEYLARPDLYMVFACLVAYGVSALHIHKPGARVAFMACMFGLAVAEVIFGIRQFAGDHGWMPFGFIKEPNERASGTFVSPIHFAGFLEAVGPFALAIAIWGTQRAWLRWICGYVAILCYVGVILSGSRGGWLASIFSLVVMAVLGIVVTAKTNRARLPGVIYATVLAAVLIPAIAYPLMKKSVLLNKRMEQLSQVEKIKAGTYDIRLANWAAAIDQWKVAPVFGTGAGTHLYYGRFFRRPELQPDPEHAHGDYLELLAEYGIIGGVGMAALLGAHWLAGLAGFRRLVAQKSEDPYGPGLQLAFNVGALTTFAAHAAHAVVDFNMHLPGNAIFLAVVFGFMANPGEEKTEVVDDGFPEDSTPEPVLASIAARSAMWATAGIGVAIIVIALPKFPGEYWCEKARVAVRNREYEKALSFGQKSLEWEQKNPFTHLHIGQAYRITAEKSPRAIRKPHYQAAIESFRRGLNIFPQDEELWVRYAQALEGNGEFKAAGDAYREAVNLDPNLGVIRSHYSRFLRRIGREAEADEQAKFALHATTMNLAPIPVHRHISEPEHEDERHEATRE
jgi:O-antigen ligase